jgi:triphosphoribosyl-dephospho-CoA synthase
MSEARREESGQGRPAISPGRLAEMACLLEVTARKPGNVHRGADFRDLHFVDFLLSATAIAAPLDRAAVEGVGAAVLAAVESTRRVVSTNTNLGMILLFAPLAAVPAGTDLARGVESVLGATTVDDARMVYRAIRLACPGGLGRAAEQDIAEEPTVTLREAMALAADRDLVARQYADGYCEVLCEALPTLRAAIQEGQPLETAIITSYLDLLSRHPDSLIARKVGIGRAEEVSRWALEVMSAGWPEDERSRRLCKGLDARLRREGNRLNPGTTADLVAAALFAALSDGAIPLPRPAEGATSWSGS